MNQGLIPAWTGFSNALSNSIAKMGMAIAQGLQLEGVLRGLTAVLNGNFDIFAGADNQSRLAKRGFLEQKNGRQELSNKGTEALSKNGAGFALSGIDLGELRKAQIASVTSNKGSIRLGSPEATLLKRQYEIEKKLGLVKSSNSNKTGALPAPPKAPQIPGAGSNPKGGGKGSKGGDGTALGLAKEEIAAQERLNELAEQSRILKERVNGIQKQSLDLAQQENLLKTGQGVEDKKLELQRVLAENQLKLEENAITVKEKLGQITEKQANRERDSIARRRAELEYNQALQQAIVETNRQGEEINTQIEQSELRKKSILEEFNIAQNERLGALQIEADKINAQILALQGKKGKEDEIAKLKAQQIENETKIRDINQEISDKKDEDLTKENNSIELNKKKIEALLEELRIRGEISKAQYDQEIAALNQNQALANKATTAWDSVKQGIQQVGQAITQAFSDGKVTLDDFKNIALSVINAVSNAILTTLTDSLNKIFQGITSAGGGGGLGIASAIGGFFKRIFGGFFASGGIAPGNKLSIVGERGPEIIAPLSASRVYNASQTEKMLNGGGTSANPIRPTKIVNLNISAMDSQSVISALAKPDVQKYLNIQSSSSYQRNSNKAFNRSSFERTR
jgi:hypothetical protein